MDSRALTSWMIPVAVAIIALSSHRIEAQTWGSSHGSMRIREVQVTQQNSMSRGVDAAIGRKLFASKGCVVCHMVNGNGGTDGAPLDASTMPGMTNPFDFVANMWRGAEPMIELQRKELGGQIEFTGEELANIIAFLHDGAEQKTFAKTDIPPKIRAAMEKMEHGEDEGEMSKMKTK
jgi:hypothetical protein